MTQERDQDETKRPLNIQLHENIRRYVENSDYSQGKLAEMAFTDQASISRFIRKKSDLRLSTALRLLEHLGFKVQFPEERERIKDVVFVRDQMPERFRDLPPPEQEDYKAVPLVGETGAGKGVVARDELRSWVLVYAHHHSVRFRTNLMAVEVGKHNRSMEPILHPMDLVLVDMDERKPLESGRGIYLVRLPETKEETAIKRVKVKHEKGRTSLIFYSDNIEYTPDTFDLNEHFEGGIDNAIVGRVVWSWSDMTKK